MPTAYMTQYFFPPAIRFNIDINVCMHQDSHAVNQLFKTYTFTIPCKPHAN